MNRDKKKLLQQLKKKNSKVKENFKLIYSLTMLKPYIVKICMMEYIFGLAKSNNYWY